MCVFTNLMNISFQLKDRELRLIVLFLLIILEMCSSAAVSLEKNPLKIWKPVRNEETTMRLSERQ